MWPKVHAMLKQFVTLTAFAFVGLGVAHADNSIDSDACTLNGFKLYGKFQVVDSFPDLKVQIVTSFPDLKVQTVTSFPDDCGEWQFVDSFPDVKIQYVDSFPDLKIEMVTSFPGLP